jgi:hypothetical protein
MKLQIRDSSDDHSRVPDILASEIICIVAATIAVVLRIFSRITRRVPLGADDYTIILALV